MSWTPNDVRYRIRRSVGVTGHGVGGPSLTDRFTADLGGSAQVVLGVLVLAAGLLLLFSTTQAGQLAGQGAMSAAKRGARFIPGVGALL